MMIVLWQILFEGIAGRYRRFVLTAMHEEFPLQKPTRSCVSINKKLVITLKSAATKHAARRLSEKDSHTHLLSTFPPRLRRILEASSEKGSSSWLTFLPLTSHGFALHKGDFRDALCVLAGNLLHSL